MFPALRQAANLLSADTCSRHIQQKLLTHTLTCTHAHLSYHHSALLSEACSASYSRAPFTASGRKTAEGLCALSHQAMREELVCVHALVQGLAEIRVNKQHIVTPPQLWPCPAQVRPSEQRQKIFWSARPWVHRARGTQRRQSRFGQTWSAVADRLYMLHTMRASRHRHLQVSNVR